MKKKLSSSFSTNTTEGVVVKTSYRKTFVSFSSGEEITVYNRYSFFALKGDLVSVVVFPNKKKRASVQIVAVKKRRQSSFVGSIDSSSGNCFFVPDDRSVYFDVFIPKKAGSPLKNKKVVVCVTDWGESSSTKSPVGKIDSVLGSLGEQEVEIESIIQSFGFNSEFTDIVLKESSGISNILSSFEVGRRKDFRDVITFTIDPEDAKDFDDAISVKKDSPTVWEVGIHIADVCAYVKPNTVIDVEAQKRGTSVYLVDRVIPMLPESLSNDVCSLNPGVDKLCFSVIFKLSLDCVVLDYSIEETVINSNKRFTYSEAQDILLKKKGLYFFELSALSSFAQKLRSERDRSGSVFFSFPEVSFSFDKNNLPVAVHSKPVLDTTVLVEEFMLLTNKIIATDLNKKLSGSLHDFIYRVHEKPDLDRLSSLKDILFSLNIPFSYSQKTLSSSINSLLKKIRGVPEEKLLETLILRSMSKAVYSSKNIGHFGLNFNFYTHFTSPIRRYSDLIVHRLIKHHYFKQPLVSPLLGPLCEALSQKEQDATKAERDSVKYMQGLYLKSHLGVVFNGFISGVVEHGFYVELLENHCEGFVKLSSLKGDSFFLHKRAFSLVGLKTKRSFSLGQKVSIQVVSVDLVKKQSVFIIC